MAESGPAKPQAPSGPASGLTRHLGNENPWYIISTAPDYCKVGNAVVGFDSFALLTNKSTASSNVKAQFGAKPLYRVGDKVSGVQANAGQGVCSTTSLATGYAIFLDGQFNVKANGLITVMDGTKCMINCNAAGIGNATAVLRTEVKPVASAPPPKGMLERMGDESGRVFSEKWKGLKESAGTVWEALPWTSDEVTTAAARTKIGDGLLNSARGLSALAGPPPEAVYGAYLSGNPEAIAAVQAMQQEQQKATAALVDNATKSWNEAEARSGTAGAVSMVATSIGVEAVGAKGAGVVGKVAVNASGIGKASTAVGAAGHLPSTPGGAGNVPSTPGGAGNVPSAPTPNGAGHTPTTAGNTGTPSAPSNAGTAGAGANGASAAPAPASPPARVPAPTTARATARVDEIKNSSPTPLEAAGRLDREIDTAKSSGWSADEIKQLEQARKDSLAQARSDAANRRQAARNGGVHVKRGRLTPNSSYELNGYRYTTDDKGRISTVEGDLRLESAERDNYAQRSVGNNDGRLPDDQGGHMIGSQFGGYGGKENLTPMAKDVNNYHSGEWGQMEKNWAERLRAGDTVHVRIEPIYNSDTLRASSFDVIETINGVPNRLTILNPG